MKVTSKIISEVVGELLGEDAVNVAFYIKGKNHVSELKVAKDLNIDVHAARSILYKLYENNLAVFERKKDRQKGWYLTYWDFYPDNIPHLYKKILKKKIEKLNNRLKSEENNEFYMCSNACVRMDFEKAVSFDFKCPECGQLMNPMNNKRTIEFIHEQIHDLKKELAKA